VRVPALVLILSGALITVTGCGGTGGASSAAELRLQREDLVAVSRALQAVERPVAREVAAAKVAWPLIANGVPTARASIARPSIAAAGENAAKVKLPGLMEEAQAASLTGPASQLAGLFRTFDGLVSRGWRLIGAESQEIQHGSPAGARFARENIALYIESVYDGHFAVAQIGKKLSDGYHTLGGPTAFGRALPQGEVDALARAYSEPTDRLHPHVGVRLGS
jgi:hypothetical protein